MKTLLFTTFVLTIGFLPAGISLTQATMPSATQLKVQASERAMSNAVYPLAPQEIGIANGRVFQLSQLTAEAYYKRGIAKYESGDKRGAIDDYNRAIALNPKFAKAYHNRGWAKYKLGDRQGTLADYNRAIALEPKYALAYYNRGRVKYDLGDKKGAITDLSKAAKLSRQQGQEDLDQQAIGDLDRINAQ